MTEEQSHNMFGQDRITSRQIDELVGLARGIAADGKIRVQTHSNPECHGGSEAYG